MKTRTIKATFTIKDGSNTSGVVFKYGNKNIQWSELTHKEQVKMLCSWAGMYQLFYNFLKEE